MFTQVLDVLFVAQVKINCKTNSKPGESERAAHECHVIARVDFFFLQKISDVDADGCPDSRYKVHSLN